MENWLEIPPESKSMSIGATGCGNGMPGKQRSSIRAIRRPCQSHTTPIPAAEATAIPIEARMLMDATIECERLQSFNTIARQITCSIPAPHCTVELQIYT